MKKITEVKITITEIDGVIVNVHPEVRNIELKKVAPVKQVPTKTLKPKVSVAEMDVKQIMNTIFGNKVQEYVDTDCVQKMDILKNFFGDSIDTYLYSEYLKEFFCNPIKANANLK